MPKRQEWDRLPVGESAKAYAAFLAYRDLPIADRSVAAAFRARRGSAEGEIPKPPGRWFIWANTHRWKDRAGAWDRAVERKTLGRLASRRAMTLESLADVGERLLAKVDLGLRLLSPFEREVPGPDGERVRVPATKMTPSDLSRMAEVGMRLMTLAVGLPDSRTAVQDGGEDEGKELLDRAKADMLAKLDAIERRQREADAAVAGVLTELNAGNGDGNGMNPMLDRSSHRPRG